MRPKIQTRLPNIGNRDSPDIGSKYAAYEKFKHAIRISKEAEQVRRYREIMLYAQYEAALRLEEIEKYTKYRLEEETRKKRILQIREDFNNMRIKNKVAKNAESTSRIPRLAAQTVKYTMKPYYRAQPQLPRRNIEALKKNTYIYKGIPDGKYRQVKPPSVLSQLYEVDVNTVSFSEFCKVLKSDNTGLLYRLYDLLGPNPVAIQRASYMLRLFKGAPRIFSAPKISKKTVREFKVAAEASILPEPLPLEEVAYKPVIVAVFKPVDLHLNTCINGIASGDRSSSAKINQIASRIGIALHYCSETEQSPIYFDEQLVLAEFLQLKHALPEYCSMLDFEQQSTGIAVNITKLAYWRLAMHKFQDSMARIASHGLSVSLAFILSAPETELFSSELESVSFVLARFGVYLVEIQENSIIFKYLNQLTQIWTQPTDFTQLAMFSPAVEDVCHRWPVCSLVKGSSGDIEQWLVQRGAYDIVIYEIGYGICLVRAYEPDGTIRKASNAVEEEVACDSEIISLMRYLGADDSAVHNILKMRPSVYVQ